MKNRILITCISTLSDTAAEVTYNSGTVSARQTNEACCKFLLRNGPRPNIIIALCTRDAVRKVTPSGTVVRSYDAFHAAIVRYCRENGCPEPAFYCVPLLRREERTNRFGGAITRVHRIVQEIGDPSETRILVDTAGGPRNISMMLLTMTRLLRYYGCRTDAFYTNLQERRIFQDHTIGQLSVMEAIAEFAEHGTVNALRARFADSSCREVSDLLDAMTQFSDSIQLCRTQELPEIINRRILPALDRIGQLQGATADHEDVAALRQMVGHIRLCFGFDPQDPGRTVTPADLVLWCLKNGMIQQAVTLFAENIPKYLFECGMLRLEHPENRFFRPVNSPEVTLLYTDIIESGYRLQYAKADAAAAELRLCLLGKGSPSSAAVKAVLRAWAHVRKASFTRKYVRLPQRFRPANDTERRLAEFIRSRSITSTDKAAACMAGMPGFLRELLCPALADAEQEDRNAAEIARKLYGIEVFSPARLAAYDPDLSVSLPPDKTDAFRHFLAYYVYIKKFVRNLLNHAAEESPLSPETAARFQRYGVCTDALTSANITENLSAALGWLRQCRVRA